jgi:hypothetical protein
MRPVPVVRKGQSDPQLSCAGLVRGSSLLTGPERETRFLDSSHSCVHQGGGGAPPSDSGNYLYCTMRVMQPAVCKLQFLK